MIRSLPRPLALVSGSTATRMALQSCSSSRRKSSGDQGWRKAARSITMTSSRSAGDMRRISSRPRARTAFLLLRRHRAVAAVERIEHADGGAAAQVGEQLAQEALVLLLGQLEAELVALRLGQGLAADGLVELVVAELGRELEAVVEVAGDAKLAGEDGADLLLGELDRAGERVVLGARGKACAQPREQRLDLARLQIEELQPLDLGEHDAL